MGGGALAPPPRRCGGSPRLPSRVAAGLPGWPGGGSPRSARPPRACRVGLVLVPTLRGCGPLLRTPAPLGPPARAAPRRARVVRFGRPRGRLRLGPLARGVPRLRCRSARAALPAPAVARLWGRWPRRGWVGPRSFRWGAGGCAPRGWLWLAPPPPLSACSPRPPASLAPALGGSVPLRCCGAGRGLLPLPPPRPCAPRWGAAGSARPPALGAPAPALRAPPVVGVLPAVRPPLSHCPPRVKASLRRGCAPALTRCGLFCPAGLTFRPGYGTFIWRGPSCSLRGTAPQGVSIGGKNRPVV